MTAASKPYQEALQMIREGLVAALADGTQGPLLVAALQSGLGLPHRLVNESGAAVSLSTAHNGAIVEILASGAIVTLRAQADYAWPTTGVSIVLRSQYPFSLATPAAVVLNGETGETWECEAWPKAVTLHWRSENVWGLTGAGTVAP